MAAQHSLNHPVRPRIVIAASEHSRLTHLAEAALERDAPVGEYLIDELSRASIVPDEDCAPNVVRMNSEVTYFDEAAQRTRTVKLVYPKDADIDQQRVSILTPIGAALIGLSPAQSIEWRTPDGAAARLTVIDVKNDPEPVA